MSLIKEVTVLLASDEGCTDKRFLMRSFATKIFRLEFFFVVLSKKNIFCLPDKDNVYLRRKFK